MSTGGKWLRFLSFRERDNPGQLTCNAPDADEKEKEEEALEVIGLERTQKVRSSRYERWCRRPHIDIALMTTSDLHHVVA